MTASLAMARVVITGVDPSSAAAEKRLSDQTVVIIPTTPDQDEAAFEYLQQFTDKNGVTWTDNCACLVQGALDAAGILGSFFQRWPLFPVDEVLRALSVPGSMMYNYPRYTTPSNLNRFDPSPGTKVRCSVANALDLLRR